MYADRKNGASLPVIKVVLRDQETVSLSGEEKYAATGSVGNLTYSAAIISALPSPSLSLSLTSTSKAFTLTNISIVKVNKSRIQWWTKNL